MKIKTVHRAFFHCYRCKAEMTFKESRLLPCCPGCGSIANKGGGLRVNTTVAKCRVIPALTPWGKVKYKRIDD